MVKFKQSHKRRVKNKSLRELIQKRKRMDSKVKGNGKKATSKEKSMLTSQINKSKEEVARLAIEENGKCLSKDHRDLRSKMERDPNSNKRMLDGVLCENGASAMYIEAESAFNKAGLKGGNNLTASGGSAGYEWIRFQDDLGNVSTVAKLPDPADYEEGADYPFPVAGMYNSDERIFAPMPLYTQYLKKVVYEGMATTVEKKPLLYIRCNYLWNIVGREKKETKNGILHVDFDQKNQYHWDEHGYPLSTILCVNGETQLRFSSVSAWTPAESVRAPKKESVVALKPGDGVVFGWKQYHATHTPPEDEKVVGSDRLGENVRLQAMLSSIPQDFPDEQDDVVFLHGNHENMLYYDAAEEQLGDQGALEKQDASS